MFVPGPQQSVEAEAVGATNGHVVAAVYDNVRSGAYVFTPSGNGWTTRRMSLPANVSISLVNAGPHDDHLFLQVTGFLTPSQLWLADAATGQATEVKSLPAQFDAGNLVVEQLEATSRDGTRIPYFLVHRRGLKRDGTNPTELTAYGGFGVSSTPLYSGAIGQLWLSRGGVYALANIRGGGEFGPAWHEAGRKTRRQRVFDDFAAVGQDLIARRITSTKDNRVGPVHARRFAWRLDQLGVPFLYYEDTEGGHSGTANLLEISHEQALEVTYLTRRLMD